MFCRFVKNIVLLVLFNKTFTQNKQPYSQNSIFGKHVATVKCKLFIKQRNYLPDKVTFGFLRGCWCNSFNATRQNRSSGSILFSILVYTSNFESILRGKTVHLIRFCVEKNINLIVWSHMCYADSVLWETWVQTQMNIILWSRIKKLYLFKKIVFLPPIELVQTSSWIYSIPCNASKSV